METYENNAMDNGCMYNTEGEQIDKQEKTSNFLDCNKDTDSEEPSEPSPDPRPPSIKHILLKHAERTSLNGVPYIAGSSNPVVKVFWGLLLFAGVCCMIFHLMMLLTAYFRYDKSSEITWRKSELEFPSITLCNVNPIKNSMTYLANTKLRDIITDYSPRKMKDKISGCNSLDSGEFSQADFGDKNCLENMDSNDGDGFPDYSDEGDDKDDGDDIDDILDDEFYDKYFGKKTASTKMLEEFLSAFNDEHVDNRTIMGHQFNDMVVSRKFKGYKIQNTNFTHFQSAHYGNCYTIDNDKFIVTKSGPSHGLEMVLSLETYEYLPGFTTSKGIQLVIHEPGTVAFPFREGMAINAGTHTHIGLRQVTFRRMGLPYGHGCEGSNSFFDKYGVKYNKQTCQQTCSQVYLRESCTCQDEREDEINAILSKQEQLPPCRNETQIKCLKQVYRKFNESTDCVCPDPCVEVAYKKTASFRQWPNFGYATILVDLLCKDKPHKCSSLRKVETDTPRDLENEFLKISIYFEDLNFEELQEKAQYEQSQFFSDVGGTIGLWIGLSILGVFEMFHFAFDIIAYFIVKIRRNGKNNDTSSKN